MSINMKLAKSRGLNKSTINEIEMCHAIRDYHYDQLDKHASDTVEFQIALAGWRQVSTELQKLWGFPVDSNKTGEWRLPKCICPQMDNDDMQCHYYVTDGCPLHGYHE